MPELERAGVVMQRVLPGILLRQLTSNQNPLNQQHEPEPQEVRVTDAHLPEGVQFVQLALPFMG